MLILTTIAEFRKKIKLFILCISWEISFGVNQKKHNVGFERTYNNFKLL